MLKKVIQGCIHLVTDYFGSGFCISPDGKILTNSHCVFDRDDPALNGSQTITVIFPTGLFYECKVLYFEEDLDCALLQIVNTERKDFPYLEIAEKLAPEGSEVYCIGQPGYEDLEVKSKKKVETGYNSFEISKGTVQGYLRNDTYLCKRTELGPMKHDCWTYWGHSGSPIFDLSGKVVGIHNTWNYKNAMRHGLSTNSIRKFLELCIKNGIKI